MKKLLLILAGAAITLSASSQTKELDNLNKQLAKSDATVANPKKTGSANTWIDRAQVLMAASKAYTKELIAGFSIEQTLNLIQQQPSNIQEIEISGKPHKRYEFENFDIYVDANGSVAFWNTKKEFRPGALDGAFDALKKAYELDPRVMSSKGYMIATDVLNQFNTDGMNLYNLGQKGEAADMFAKAAETNQMIGTVDSVMIYYAGVAYNEAGEYDKAIEYLDKAREIGYDQQGGVDSYIAYIQQQQGKDEEAIATLEAAIVKYPKNNQLVTQLIDLYVQTKRSPDKVVAMIDQAKQLDPNNGALYLLEGSLWDQIGDPDKAEAAFLEATKIEPNNYVGYMNAGIMQARKGDKLVEKAQALDVKDIKGYDALIEQAVPFYDRAIELLEKAHEVQPDEIAVVSLLKSLYYQKVGDGPEMEAKFNYYNDLYNAMEAK